MFIQTTQRHTSLQRYTFKACAAFAWTLLLAPVADTQAANPILYGYADPHLRVWNGKMYISVGNDESPEFKHFSITHWSIYSSENLVDWALETHIDPADTYLGKGYKRCWASDIADKDGSYYLYTSNGGSETSVFRADNPAGPYEDVLKRPMLEESMSINHEYDPTIFTEDNGDKYIIYGRDGMLNGHLLHYQIAKLSDDMLSIEGEPRDLLTTKKFGFGAENRARDHQYFHKHDGIYYLSCAGLYMTSNTLYGPYDNPRHTGQNGHTSISEYHGQDYYAYEWTAEPHGVRQFRQTNLTYLHYKDNGDMVAEKAFLQDSNVAERGMYYEYGVANYDANWERIEAEWFFKIHNAVKRESPAGGFEIQQIVPGAYLNFPKVRNVEADDTIRFRVASITGATIEIRQGSETGTLLGTCDVPATGGCDRYETIQATFQPSSSIQDLYFVFKGESVADLLHLDWFSLKL